MSKIEEFSIINQINSGQIKREPTPFPIPLPTPLPTNPTSDSPAQTNSIRQQQVPNPKPARDAGDIARS